MSTPSTPQSDPAYTAPTTPYPNLPTQQFSEQSTPSYEQSAPNYEQSAPNYEQSAQSYQAAPTNPYLQAASPAPSTATTLGSTNTFALLAIIFAFVSPLAGIIFGHMGLGQIKRTGDAGRGIALTGLIISYAYFVLVLVFIVIYVGMIAVMIGSLGAAISGVENF